MNEHIKKIFDEEVLNKKTINEEEEEFVSDDDTNDDIEPTNTKPRILTLTVLDDFDHKFLLENPAKSPGNEKYILMEKGKTFKLKPGEYSLRIMESDDEEELAYELEMAPRIKEDRLKKKEREERFKNLILQSKSKM